MYFDDEDVTKQARKKRYKVLVGPITRAQAKLFNEELHNLIKKLQRKEINVFEIEAIQKN